MKPFVDQAPPNLRPIWHALGWLGVALIIYLSLMPDPPTVSIEQGDKLQHIVAYAALMLWFAQLAIPIERRLPTAVALVALGIGLEYAQRATGYRTFDYYDMAADAIGVGLGWLLAPPRLPSLLALSERIAARALKTESASP